MFTPTHTSNSTRARTPGKKLPDYVLTAEEKEYEKNIKPLFKKAEAYLIENFMRRGMAEIVGIGGNGSRIPNCITVGVNDEQALALIPGSVEVTDDAGDKHQIPVNKIVTGKFYANKGLADEEIEDNKTAVLKPGN